MKKKNEVETLKGIDKQANIDTTLMNWCWCLGEEHKYFVGDNHHNWIWFQSSIKRLAVLQCWPAVMSCPVDHQWNPFFSLCPFQSVIIQKCNTLLIWFQLRPLRQFVFRLFPLADSCLTFNELKLLSTLKKRLNCTIDQIVQLSKHSLIESTTRNEN